MIFVDLIGVGFSLFPDSLIDKKITSGWFGDRYRSVVHLQQLADETQPARSGRWMGLLFWCPSQRLHSYSSNTSFCPAVRVPRNNRSDQKFQFRNYILIIILFNVEREMFVATLLGNSLWLVALSYYIYITFLGYSSLNLLTRTHYFLAPLTLLAVFFILTLCLNWNLSNSLMYFYKYRVL